MAINPSAPSPNFRNTVSENIEDPVSFELMTRAVTLVPCGHILNEDTAIKCLARNKLCPLGKELIEKYIPNYTIRTLAEAAIAHLQEEGPSEEAQQLFQKGKALSEQNNHEAAIPLLLETLQLSPSYEKAQAYLDFCLQRSSGPAPNPIPSPEKKESIESIHRAPAPQNSKEAYINLLLMLLEEPEIQKREALPKLFKEQVEELMSQEAFTQKQQESYTWTQKLFIDHRVSSFVAEKLQTLHAESRAPSLSPQPPKVSPKLFPAPIANPNPIQPLPKEVIIPKNAFGKAKWAQYFGYIGIEPPLPPNLHEILNAHCPFWPGKRVQETHLLTLIPATVNGRPFTLNSLNELIQNPQWDGKATQYSHYWDKIKKEYGNTAPAASYWVLMTKDVIPESRMKKYEAQKQLLATYSQKARLPYEIPHLLESATSILMEHVQSRTRLYSDSPCTYTRCQERVSSNPNYPLVVGGFSAVGLLVSGLAVYITNDDEYEYGGVGGCWRF